MTLLLTRLLKLTFQRAPGVGTICQLRRRHTRSEMTSGVSNAPSLDLRNEGSSVARRGHLPTSHFQPFDRIPYDRYNVILMQW